MRTSLGIALCLGVACVPQALRAGDWPQFRGPNGSATSADKQLPAEWGADKNIAWQAQLPGYGWSSPIVWGDKVFVTTAVSDKQRKPSGGFGGGGGGSGFGRGQRPPDAVYKWEVYCLNAADGKVLWKQIAAEKKPTIPTHGSNTYATETPVTDGERVYAYFGMTGVYLLRPGRQAALEGGPRLATRWRMGYGTGSSPVLDERPAVHPVRQRGEVVPGGPGRQDRQGTVADVSPRADRAGARRWSGRTRSGRRWSAWAARGCARTTRPRASSCGNWAA